MSRKNQVRVGVLGVGRGGHLSKIVPLAGMRLVALCDTNEAALREKQRELGVTTYTDFDEFLGHDLDAVVVANYFHQHAPFAIRALQAGKHVLSECSACHTLGEAAALARAAERSGKIYMLAENYPYMLFNQEMRRWFRKGFVGDFVYGEGEYVHPASAQFWNSISPGPDHWRNWMPGTYYCTHSIAPAMYITGTRPVKVSGFVLPYDDRDPSQAMRITRADHGAVIMCTMDNGALLRSLHSVSLRGHRNYVRIHGNKGLMENPRIGPEGVVRLYKDRHDTKDGNWFEDILTPELPRRYAKVAESGHGGGDFFVCMEFARAIRTGQPPFFDVHRAIDVSIAGILAYQSALQGSVPVALPDFRKESVRKRWEDDDWSPDPARRRKGQPWPSILGNITPSPKAVAAAKRIHAARDRA